MINPVAIRTVMHFFCNRPQWIKHCIQNQTNTALIRRLRQTAFDPPVSAVLTRKELGLTSLELGTLYYLLLKFIVYVLHPCLLCCSIELPELTTLVSRPSGLPSASRLPVSYVRSCSCAAKYPQPAHEHCNVRHSLAERGGVINVCTVDSTLQLMVPVSFWWVC